ncbi:glycosyltransferase family 2 protein [Allohahella marinimesophila]|uniref:Glycosyltransferase n=1 Tax=Allohahella marinimesophila TaxID=1054972 RepID=A0ABP7PX62_9GAMM
MTSNKRPLVTLIVVPREKFSCTFDSLDSIIAHTKGPYELIYVDGRSPKPVRDGIAKRCTDNGFDHVRVERFLPTNVARNIGLKRARGKYIAFVENDVVVSPGWLEALVDCAEETGATVTGPLICEGRPIHSIIHCAGGVCGIKSKPDEQGKIQRHLYELLAEQKKRVDKVPLERKQTELAEFHCMMIRKDYLDEVGGLDPNVLNTREHVDFCISVMHKGGTVWLEPKSIVTYLFDTSLMHYDVPFFMYRWGDNSERSSLLYLKDKWNLTIDRMLQKRLDSIGKRRRHFMIVPFIKSLTGGKGGKRFNKALVEGSVLVDRGINRLLFAWNDRKPITIVGGESNHSGAAGMAQK